MILTEWFLDLTALSQTGLLYLAAMNIVTFFYFGLDKLRSTKEGARRIREMTLWLLSLAGGSAGALLAMKVFRHKTKKITFQAGMAVILAIQILAVYFLALRQ